MALAPSVSSLYIACLASGKKDKYNKNTSCDNHIPDPAF